MEIVEAIILLLSGLGVFLVGVKLLSENMEKLAGKTVLDTRMVCTLPGVYRL